MKAVVMAGGEGSRLRPMTASMPKPLLPVATRPIMEHVLLLLRQHGITDAVVTVHYLASLIRNYFGDGEDWGMDLTYATEVTPLGTAGSVKNGQDLLCAGTDEPFLVISGDALTDINLADLIAFHKEKGALVTVCLTRVPNPLDFGITIVDEDGRVQRFLEKPGWGQVFSDTVNTGIYVMEQEVLDYVGTEGPVDWSEDVFPRLMAEGKPIFGFVASGYWEDVGTYESYQKAHADVLEGKVKVQIEGFEVSPGIWVGEGAEVHHDAIIKGPVLIGSYAKVEAGVEVRDHSVIGSNVVVRSGASLHRAVVHDNVFIGPSATLRSCVVGKNTDVMRGSRVEEGAIIGDECVLEEEAIISAGVKVYPFKTIEAGAVVHSSVIFEQRGQRNLFGQYGVSGIINVEITPELAVRLSAAFATTLRKGTSVTIARDVSRAARAVKRAIVAALNSSAINVHDLEVVPEPVCRLRTAQFSSGGIFVRTSPGLAENLDILFFDDSGADLSPNAQRKLERVFSRQEFRRAFPGEIGDLEYPPRAMEDYARDLLNRVNVGALATHETKIVVDPGGGAVSTILPTLLARLPATVFSVNAGLDEKFPTESAQQRRESLERLGEYVTASGAALGVRFDRVGERMYLVDDSGEVIDDDRALLIVLDLVAAERRSGTVALPVTTTRVAEHVARFHNVGIEWTTTSPDDLARACAKQGMILGADGRGGFVIPESSPMLDGLAAFVRLAGLVAGTRLPLSQINDRIPRQHLLHRRIPTPWAAKGSVMRRVVEEAGSRTVDTTDGVRVVEDQLHWALILPDQDEAETHVWVEAAEDDGAQALMNQWVAVVESVS